jgi:hypothetical protein
MTSSRWAERATGMARARRLVLPALLAVAAALGGGPSRAARAEPAPGTGDPAPPPRFAHPDAAPAPPPEPVAHGDAEPAPPEPPPTPAASGAPRATDTLPHPSRHRVVVAARFAYRLGEAGRAVGPAAGYGVGGGYEFTYATLARTLDLALGVAFSSDRFATSEKGLTTQSGMTIPYDSTRVIQESAFLLTQTAAVRLGPVRPFVSVAVGLGVGDLDSVDPTYAPGTLRDAQLLAGGAAGLDVVIGRVWSATLRAAYTTVHRADPLRTVDGRTLAVFGDQLDVDLGLVYRF